MSPPIGRPAVFLDRDGVLILAQVRKGRPYAPACLEEMEILPGVPEACTRLRQAGYLLVLVTNQPDVARGMIEKRKVEQINESLKEKLHLQGIYTCYHDDGDRCDCRKPKPGLLLAAADALRIDLPSSIMVGDRWRDVEAGLNAGCRTILVDYGYSEPLRRSPHRRVSSLAEAVEYILGLEPCQK